MSRHRLPCTLAFFMCLACSPSPQRDAENSSPRAETGEARLTAGKVVVDVALPDGQLVVRGDHLSLLDGGGTLVIEGDASVAFEGNIDLKAGAGRAKIRLDGPALDMIGDVHARIAVPDVESTDENP